MQNAYVHALRGAVSIEEDTKSAIENAVRELLSSLMTQNALKKEDIISMTFSVTKDIESYNPATAARFLGYKDNLFCTQEAYFIGSMPKVIRILMYLNLSEKTTLSPIYLGRASALRSDLSTQNGLTV